MRFSKHAILAIIAFFFFANGCQKPPCENYTEECGCPPMNAVPKVELKDIVYSNMVRKNHLLGSQKYDENDVIEKNENLEIQLYASRNKIVYLSKPSFSLLASAHACSFTYTPQSDHEFRGIAITSDSDFDQDHPAGENLSELFFSPQNLNSTVETFAAENINRFLFSGDIQLQLKPNPTIDSVHRFTITLHIDDEEYVIETPKVVFEL